MQGALETSLYTPQDVRDVLRRLMIIITEVDQDQIDRDSVELVLAEALNNIQEHGQLSPDAIVSVNWRWGKDLTIAITDPGRPCPKAILFNAKLPEPEQMAEGGYGWGLIQLLCAHVKYVNIKGSNTLTLVFAGK